MNITAYKTHQITQGESLFGLIDAYVPALQEESILVVTSKIVSLCEGSVVRKEAESKEDVVRRSADAYFQGLTIKNRMLIPFAGVDESNGNGVYILHPEDVQQSAASLWEYVRKRDKINHAGILITDSSLTPLRRGVHGIGLGWCGFKPLYNYIGKQDCFGAPLRMTMRNNLDGLAAAAVFCMGEGDEQTPLAVITAAPKIEFQTRPPTDEEKQELSIPMDEDFFAPLLKRVEWNGLLFF